MHRLCVGQWKQETVTTIKFCVVLLRASLSLSYSPRKLKNRINFDKYRLQRDGRAIQLNLWDTAGQVRKKILLFFFFLFIFKNGVTEHQMDPLISYSLQEKYRSIAPVYYRDADAALVLYDVTRQVSHSKILEFFSLPSSDFCVFLSFFFFSRTH